MASQSGLGMCNFPAASQALDYLWSGSTEKNGRPKDSSVTEQAPFWSISFPTASFQAFLRLLWVFIIIAFTIALGFHMAQIHL